MNGDGATKRAWIKRVLGVDVGAPRQPLDLARAVAEWQRALEAVDAQIAALRQRLLAAPDPELHEIAEFGLGAMTGSHKVKIQAALIEVQSGAEAKRKATAQLVSAFRTHLASDPRIAACDASRFGVTMSIRQTLTPALDALQSALQTAS